MTMTTKAKVLGEAWADVAEGGGPDAIEVAVRLSREALAEYEALPVCARCHRRGGLYLGDDDICAACAG